MLFEKISEIMRELGMQQPDNRSMEDILAQAFATAEVVDPAGTLTNRADALLREIRSPPTSRQRIASTSEQDGAARITNAVLGELHRAREQRAAAVQDNPRQLQGPFEAAAEHTGNEDVEIEQVPPQSPQPQRPYLQPQHDGAAVADGGGNGDGAPELEHRQGGMGYEQAPPPPLPPSPRPLPLSIRPLQPAVLPEEIMRVPVDQQLIRSPEVDPGDRIKYMLRELEATGSMTAEQPTSMLLALYDVQKQTLRWMLDQETDERCDLVKLFMKPSDTTPPSYRCELTGMAYTNRPPPTTGGMLCDDPGFGKTIIMAALILSNVHDAALALRRAQLLVGTRVPLPTVGASLIVVPMRLLHQWQVELCKAQAGLASYDERRLTMYEHHHKVERTELERCLATSDVVLTTPERLKNDVLRLRKVVWWRVVFDESGQAAFGDSSATLHAARSLHAVHKWVMSGTPLRKSLNSLCGQLSVLGLEPADADHAAWWAAAAQRLGSAESTTLVPILRKVIVRHSHGQRFAAPPQCQLIPLPEREMEYVPVTFGEGSSHHVVYRALEHLARLESKARGFASDKLLYGFPERRMQELMLVATHPCTVELGMVAARIPQLQTAARVRGKPPPSRRCTLDELLQGISVECAAKLGFESSTEGLARMRARVQADNRCCVCRRDLSGSDCGRIVVPGCYHSYCTGCLTEKFSRNETVFCVHPDHNIGRNSRRNRPVAHLREDHSRQGDYIQIGDLRQICSAEALQQWERGLDPSEAWQALDKRAPAGAGVDGSPLTELCVQCCDSQLQETARTSEVYNKRYVTVNRCFDGKMDERVLSQQLVTLPASADILASPSIRHIAAEAQTLDDVCPICLKDFEQPIQLACNHTVCRKCLEELIHAGDRHGDATASCPLCRNELARARPLMFFCGKSCSIRAFEHRLQKTPTPPIERGTLCNGLRMVDNDTQSVHTEACRERLGVQHHRCVWTACSKFGGLRFHSAACAKAWFIAHLKEGRCSGNRLLYEPGEQTRDLSKFTPLMRPQGTSYFAMEPEWNKYVVSFPGMPHGSFLAHFDASSGRRAYGLQDPPLSPKLDVLMQMIQELRADHTRDLGRKCLVFSQSRQLLELVSTLLEAEYGDGCFCYAKEGGQQGLDVFNADEAHFALLLEAGAFAAGLTLTRADTCFILEPQLDEALQAQIANRIYRPGQRYAVRIITLYMVDSVEELVVQARTGADRQRA